MKQRKVIAVILLCLLIYGACIVSLKGKLPNQTSAIVDVEGKDILSLAFNYTEILYSFSLPLDKEQWIVSGQSCNKANSAEGTLVINGTIKDYSKPLFSAILNVPLIFSEFPFLQVNISSIPDVKIDLLVKNEHKWINVSSSTYLAVDEQKCHLFAVNITEEILKQKIFNRNFSGLGIIVNYIGYKPRDYYNIEINSIRLLRKFPYYLSRNEGRGCTLPDKSIAYIVKKENFVNITAAYPYLQRVYVLYSMDAEQNALYTIFVATKDKGNLTASRIGFVFTHTNRLGGIGTHIDWRQLQLLNVNFDPMRGLYSFMEDGDLALIFPSINENQIYNVQLHKIELTFSRILFSEFMVPHLHEHTLFIASIVLLIIAGIIPTASVILLLCMHKKSILNNIAKNCTLIIALGLILRCVLAPITAYSNDLQIFAQLGALYFGSGVLGAQWVSLPGFVYIQTATYFPYALIRAFGFQDFQFMAQTVYMVESFFVKVPSIIGDLGSVCLLRKISRKYMPDRETLITGLFMLNPLNLYVSGILGQFDTIFVFFILLTIYHLIIEHDKIKATICSCFATITNPVGAASFIAALVNIKKKENIIAVFKSLFLFCTIFGISILPFFLEPMSPVLLASYERFLGGIPGDAIYTKQFGFYRYGIYIPSSVGYGLTFRFLLQLFGYEACPFFYPYGAGLIFIILVIIFLNRTIKGRAEITNMYSDLFTVTFLLGATALFQLTFPLIYDQFVTWIMGLLIVTNILSKDDKFLLLYVIISIATGFAYVAVWRSYLLLISGVEKAQIGNPNIANLAGATIGTLYSLLLTAIFINVLKLWFKSSTVRFKSQVVKTEGCS